MNTVILLLKTHTQFFKRNYKVGAAILMLCCYLVNYLQAFSHFLVQMLCKGHIAKEKSLLSMLYTYILIYACISMSGNLLKDSLHTADYFQAGFVGSFYSYSCLHHSELFGGTCKLHANIMHLLW